MASKCSSKYVETNKGTILVRKYGFGWAVFAGKYETVGSFGKLVDLVAAINACEVR